MDFGAREILVIVAILTLIGIVLDGLRRVKRSRYESLQMSSRKLHKNAREYSNQDDDFDQSQFPSGGSRVVASRDIADIVAKSGNKVYLNADSLLLNLLGDADEKLEKGVNGRWR